MTPEEQGRIQVVEYYLQAQRIATFQAVTREHAAKKRVQELEHAAEYLWSVLANVSGGDWTLQSAEWQAASAKARDGYFTALAKYKKGTP
jgi:hypothetical protein